jgi:hypothetical protein
MAITLCSLVVAFEREMAPVRLPYLGQTSFMGHIEGLLTGYPVRSPRGFVSACVSPEVRAFFDWAVENGELAHATRDGLPFEVPQRWFDAEEGWKMAATIGHALATARVESGGLLAIAGELTREANELSAVLEEACRRNIRFNLELEECCDPPLKLREWVDADLAELAQDIIKVLKDNGIDVEE